MIDCDAVTILGDRQKSDPNYAAKEEAMNNLRILKKYRNDWGHLSKSLSNINITDVKNTILSSTESFLEHLATILPIPAIEIDRMIQKIKIDLDNIENDVQDRVTVVNIAKEELKKKYSDKIDKLFQNGDFKHHFEARFSIGDQQKSYSEILDTVTQRRKGILIEGEAGTGKTCLSWYEYR